jgi:hypothetical protein
MRAWVRGRVPSDLSSTAGAEDVGIEKEHRIRCAPISTPFLCGQALIRALVIIVLSIIYSSVRDRQN